MSDKIYQIKVGEMYVEQPQVEIVREGDSKRRFMGFLHKIDAPDKHQFKYHGTSYSDEPKTLAIDNDILEFIEAHLVEKHGREKVEVFEMYPVKVSGGADQEEMTDEDAIEVYGGHLLSFAEQNGIDIEKMGLTDVQFNSLALSLEASYNRLVSDVWEERDKIFAALEEQAEEG